ncbi:MAG: sulfatase-like hydrolase/transferase [Chitinophagaceae bacterium]|nr:sulfatase-like hydrolase/transferase [Chitinophagaceae bacterium]
MAPTKFFASTGGLRGCKQDLYEGGIRIPFIARWPGKIPAGKSTSHISAQYDLMATLAELTGSESVAQ